MINVEETIISQYGESASITQLVRGIDNYLDPRADIELFIEQVWDITTAGTWGLDQWGKIVNIPRYIKIPDDITIPPSSATRVFYIPDEDYRGYILFKAATNISDCSAKSINALISNKFKDSGRAYVLDTGQMTMRYVFEFALSFWEEALFTSSQILPRTTGVEATFFIIESTDFLGFFGSDFKPFNQAPFTNRQPTSTTNVLGFYESDYQPFNQAPFTDRS